MNMYGKKKRSLFWNERKLDRWKKELENTKIKQLEKKPKYTHTHIEIPSCPKISTTKTTDTHFHTEHAYNTLTFTPLKDWTIANQCEKCHLNRSKWITTQITRPPPSCHTHTHVYTCKQANTVMFVYWRSWIIFWFCFHFSFCFVKFPLVFIVMWFYLSVKQTKTQSI